MVSVIVVCYDMVIVRVNVSCIVSVIGSARVVVMGVINDSAIIIANCC